jgi:hypothetical protein
MTENQKKVVDALKRFPAQKECYVKIIFNKQGAQIVTDLLDIPDLLETMKHLSNKQKAIVNI